MNESRRKMIKDYLTICLLALYLLTSIVSMFCPKVKEMQPVIKDNLELLDRM